MNEKIFELCEMCKEATMPLDIYLFDMNSMAIMEEVFELAGGQPNSKLNAMESVVLFNDQWGNLYR